MASKLSSSIKLKKYKRASWLPDTGPTIEKSTKTGYNVPSEKTGKKFKSNLSPTSASPTGSVSPSGMGTVEKSKMGSVSPGRKPKPKASTASTSTPSTQPKKATPAAKKASPAPKAPAAKPKASNGLQEASRNNTTDEYLRKKRGGAGHRGK